MNRFKWFFMSKYKKLMYSLPIYMSNEQRVHLECGLVLDFKTMTIKTEEEDQLTFAQITEGLKKMVEEDFE